LRGSRCGAKEWPEKVGQHGVRNSRTRVEDIQCNFPLSQIHFAIKLYLRACRSVATCISEDVVDRSNILILTADDLVFELPVGFGERLHARLDQEMTG
jgi:hypothetical protein